MLIKHVKKLGKLKHPGTEQGLGLAGKTRVHRSFLRRKLDLFFSYTLFLP